MQRDLPECLRAVVLLRVAGMKYREIADQLQKPLGTIKQRIHRARNEFNQSV